ncbi:PH domain-containing protein [Geopseudomonas aromaticivorans]
MTQESTLWNGSPSHVENMGTYILCALFSPLVIPLFIALWKWLEVRTTKVELTTQRIIMRRGILSRRTDELELYRVKDYSVEQPFFMRLFSLGNVVISTSDRSHPQLTISAVKNAEQLREKLRSAVEERRRLKGVREID